MSDGKPLYSTMHPRPPFFSRRGVWSMIKAFFGFRPKISREALEEVPYCARFITHFSPTNYPNCRYCGACGWCGGKGHKFQYCPSREKLVRLKVNEEA